MGKGNQTLTKVIVPSKLAKIDPQGIGYGSDYIHYDHPLFDLEALLRKEVCKGC